MDIFYRANFESAYGWYNGPYASAKNAFEKKKNSLPLYSCSNTNLRKKMRSLIGNVTPRKIKCQLDSTHLWMTRRYYRVNRFASKKRIKHVRDIIISRDTIHRFEILLKVQLNFLTTIPLERQIDTKRFLFGHDRTSSPRNSPQPARVTRYVTTRQRNFDVYPATLLNFIMLRNTAISRNPIPIRCA